MDYGDLRSMLLPFAEKGWPASVAANQSYDIIGLTSGNPPVPITVQQLEAALAAQLPGAPISALLGAVPSALTDIANQFTTQLEMKALTLQTGGAEGADFAIASFSVSLDPTDHTAEFSGLTIEDYELQLTFVPTGADLVWNPILVASTAFLGVTCGLQVGLIKPSLKLALSQGDSSTIDTILGNAGGTSLSSLATAMDLDLGQSPVTLDLFQANADLGAAEFDCTIGLGFTGAIAWGPFGLGSLAIRFTHGGGDTNFGASVVASIAGHEVDAQVAYDGAAGTKTLSGSCLATGSSLADFWNALGGQLGVGCPVPGLDDVHLNGFAVSVTNAPAGTSFDIHCGGTLVFDAIGAPISFDFSFDKEAAGDIVTKLKLSDLEFDLTTHGNALVFSFTGPQPLPLADLVAAAQFNVLTGLANHVNLTLEAADLILVRNPPGSTSQILFAAQLAFDATVSSDILTMITGADRIGCTGATLFGANGAWTLDQINAVPGRAVTIDQPVPQGVSAIPALAIGSVMASVPLAPPTTSNSPGSGSGPSPAPPDPYAGVPATAGTWFNIGKQIGPVYVDRLGLGFDTGSDGVEILLMADAAFTLGPLTVTLSGFEISVPYSTPTDVSVSLQGLNLSYNNPPLTIEGGFLMAGDGVYLGDLTIKTETFLLGAIGEYAKKSDYTSLAIFAAMTEPPLGGPVFCFVEGLAAGFGYNSALNIPTQASDVANFALVQVASGGLPATDPFGIIESCISPREGSDWIAVGLVFRSFEIVESVALLTVTFGNDLQFAILGQSEMSLPPASDERIAYAQVDVIAQYNPSQQALSVSGILTPKSYVLSPACHIQGGFLYMIDGSGRFVISYGGYAPGFDYQSLGYPAVPRLRLSWTIDSHTSIVGEEYAALTPAAMMAGGSLKATWDCGIFSAWFDVSVDVLIQWRPFHYEADFSMSLGVSFDLKILFVHIHFTFHIGATLTIHGPPFGGHAHIDLDVISFDVDFGADNSGPAALDWTGFRAMLPGDPATDAADSPLLSAMVTDGLVKDCTGNAQQRVGAVRAQVQTKAPVQAKAMALAVTAPAPAATPDWVVNGTHFCFAIKSSLPITRASTGNVSVIEAPVDASVGILPMAVGSADGTLDVVITGPDGVISASTDPTAEISVAPLVTQGAPALWGQSKPGDNNTPPIPMTTGYVIKGGMKASTETMIVDVADLLDENILVQAVSERVAQANPFIQEAIS